MYALYEVVKVIYSNSSFLSTRRFTPCILSTIYLHEFCKKTKRQIELRKADNEHADSRFAVRVCFTPRRVCGKQILLKQIYLSSVVNIKPTAMKMSDAF